VHVVSSILSLPPLEKDVTGRLLPARRAADRPERRARACGHGRAEA
jgi:hypothetical protein